MSDAPFPELTLELNVGLILVSGDPWEVRSFNQTAEEWFGFALREGVLISQLIPMVNERGLKRRLARGRVASFDIEVQDELKLPVEFTCRETDLIEGGGVILEGVELTRAKSAEAMLSSYSLMVEEQTRELQAAVSSRDAFLASMSHELRTPLNLMIGFCEALLDEVYGDLDKEQERVLQSIYMNGQGLLSLLNNLLQLSRLRSGKIELVLKSVNLNEVCQRVLSNFEELAAFKEIDLSLESITSLSPLADEQWCEQMLTNLINNAIKFTPMNRRVGLRIEEGPIGVRVVVWDEGVGIPTDSQTKIFQPFTQVESTLSRSFEGSGLGLSLVSEIVRLHQGEISVQSTVNVGSKFYLDLPTAPH